MSFAEKDRKQWEKSNVPTMLFMSSESATEDGEDVLLIKDLQWRSDKVGRFFQNLDAKEEKSSQAK